MNGNPMRRPWTRATAVSTATALLLTLTIAPPVAAQPRSPDPDSSEEQQEFDALALAEQTGEPVEIPGLTDEKTQHFANPDGSLTAEISTIPQRVRSDEGWVDVDTTLVKAEDGAVRPRAAGMDIAFSGGGDDAMAHIGIGSNNVALGWIDDLPEPFLDGDQATYTDVLRDVDLVLTAGVEGFSQVLVVHTPEAAQLPELTEIALPLRTTGVTMTADEHGNLDATGDAGGQSVFSAQAPAMWDSTGEAHEDEDPTVSAPSGARVLTVPTSVEVDSIRLLPDQGMLVDEATEFPVYIDPSVSASRPNWAYVDSAFPGQAYYNPKVDDVGIGRVEWDRPYTRRAFFQFTVMARTNHPNTIINSATLRTEIEWGWDCTSNAHIQLHRTDAFTNKTTWSNQPTTRTLQDTQNVRGGWATCPKSSGVEFDATNAYRWGVNNNASHIRLRLKERDERGTTAWRRVNTKSKPPVLVVNYNHPPEKPVTSTISDSLGGTCQTDRSAPRMINNTEVRFNAQIRDRDSYWVGQQVKSQFEWKLAGVDGRVGTADSAYVTVGKWSGGSYRPVTAKDLPERELIAYRVRGHDRSNWGPWSSWCFIEVDTTKPDSGPKVTSTDYPAGDEPHGSVGRTGEFTFSNNGVDAATAYHYSVNDASCSTKVDLDEQGATVTLPISPRRDGPNLIHARITDAYGNSSECGLAYTFTVAPAAEPVAHFTLDEGQGTTATDTADTSRSATASGDVAWTRGRVGERTGGSYRLEGAGLDTSSGERLSTQGPVVRTDDAFSVSAWVRLDESDPSRPYTAVSQDGERHGGFYLGYQHTQGGRWIFKQAPYDGDATAISEAVRSIEPAQTGVWTHLLGTHDPETGALTLYVDGVNQGSHIQKTPWNAEGPLIIGGAKYRGTYNDFWPGSIDDVRVWDRVLVDDSLDDGEGARSEVWELANRPAALEGRWQLDETSGTVATDTSDHDLDATLEGDPLTAWNQAMNDVTFAPGVSLDPSTREHLYTSAPSVRTDRSYSAAAWVRLDEVGYNAAAVAQNGTDHSAFYLSYQHTYDWDNWVMKLPPQDRTGATGWHRSLSEHAPEFGRWTHLAATYDHTMGEATLYVDAVAQEPVKVPGAWHANGPVMIGGSQFEKRFSGAWAGDISDVHLYQGVLSQDDIQNVYEGMIPTSSP
ncbi:LamG-like jellyroll fold domain-containing protein [Nocardiopsis eucommiae]|uniref:LamG-like jellyroll fold domain-containing protein n=1 Tax=Nocardiopsis eucommiae TaxID=2831970 RepID=UPI003D73F4FC